MIFPILDGLSPFRKVPITWILVLANVFLFSQNWQLSNMARSQLEQWYDDPDFMETQGRVYAQFLKSSQAASVRVDRWEDIRNQKFLGALAFQDEVFLQQAGATAWVGDQVAIRGWREGIHQYLQVREFYPAYAHGVHSGEHSLFSFLSYQFFHEGALHLFGNLLLILLVGNYLEKRHSGLLLFGTYVASGAGAALLYTAFIGTNGAPLIGASGSLCGLIGLLFAGHFHAETRVCFFVLPKDGYFGVTRLQTGLWVPWLCVLEDVSGWLSRPELYSGGISNFIHLMGFVVGCGIGLLVLFSRRRIGDAMDLPYENLAA